MKDMDTIKRVKLGSDFTAEQGGGKRPHQKMLWGGESSERVRLEYPGEGTHPMHQETFELNCSRTSLAMDGTLVVVVEMSLSTWLVCAEVPGLERRAMMKMSVDEAELLSQLHRWRDEAEKRADCRVSRICVAYEAGRDGFWLARCLRGNGIEAHVMHSTSIPVKRDHRRAKTDRLDCQLMMRAFLGWLRREEGHCRMVAVPTAEQEDARRVTRERKGLVREQTKLINRLKAMFACLGIRNFKPHLKKAPERLDGLLTPEGEPIPANTLAEIRRAMDRLVLVRAQIKEIEYLALGLQSSRIFARINCVYLECQTHIDCERNHIICDAIAIIRPGSH